MSGNRGQVFMSNRLESRPAGSNERLAGAVSQWLCRVCGGSFTLAGERKKGVFRKADSAHNNIV
jgi:hypothetical protein